MIKLLNKGFLFLLLGAVAVPAFAQAQDERTIAEICLQDYSKAPRQCATDIQNSFDESPDCIDVVASVYSTIAVHAEAGQCTYAEAEFCVTQGGSSGTCGGG